MSDEKKQVVIHRDGSVTEQRSNDLPIVLLPSKQTAQHGVEPTVCPKCGHAVGGHNALCPIGN